MQPAVSLAEKTFEQPFPDACVRFFCEGLRGIILRTPQFVVFSLRICNKVIMRTMLDDLSLVEDHDRIAEFAGREAMADVNGRRVTADFIKSGVDYHFGNRIERCCGFIQNNKRRVPI